MIKQFLRRLRRPRVKAVKVVVDGENLLHALKELKRGDIEVSKVLASSKDLLEANERIKEIYFYDTYREGDLNQAFLRKELKKNTNAKVIIKLAKAIISGMTRKSRIDPYIIVEIMETTWQPEYRKVILYSGDSDFEVPLKKIKKWGIKSVVISSKSSLSKELKTVADQVIYLEELLAKIAGEMVA